MALPSLVWLRWRTVVVWAAGADGWTGQHHCCCRLELVVVVNHWVAEEQCAVTTHYVIVWFTDSIACCSDYNQYAIITYMF